jgi:hypothetical protein
MVFQALSAHSAPNGQLHHVLPYCGIAAHGGQISQKGELFNGKTTETEETAGLEERAEGSFSTNCLLI